MNEEEIKESLKKIKKKPPKTNQNRQGMDKHPNDTKDKNPKKKSGFNFMYIYIAIFFLLLAVSFLGENEPKQINYYEFESDMLKSGDVEKLDVYKEEDIIYVHVYIKPDRLSQSKYDDVRENANSALNGRQPQYYFTEGSYTSFENKLKEAQKDIQPTDRVPVAFKKRTSIWSNWLIQILVSISIFVLVWVLLMRRMVGGGGGGQIFNIGKSKAQLYSKDKKSNITFKDVAGLQEAKEEVIELVDFLKTPKKYTDLGGKIPKGALLVGPPGTGKTLLAKAVAGEAQVPFFSISGSDFVEMFVGVGASRVRDLFKQAKEKAPCIVFIDEIDAIGRARGKNNIVGGNDERENTLNQLLVEMDGFGTNSGVIIMAATNRADVLDGALLRAGRFDRQISIDKPDIVGRQQIFDVHIKPLKMAKDVSSKKLAELTPGFAGADIANVCNEAALVCARRNKKKVDFADFQSAIDRIIGGLEKKNKIISPKEKKIVAYHEAGHAIAGWFLEHADTLLKVTIVPRGVAALGYAQYLPKEQYLYTKEQLIDTMCMAMAGRVAEDIIFGKISTGAQNDLERITKLTYAMITLYGMNERVGNISFNPNQGEYNFNKPYSEKTSELIDEEVRNMVSFIYKRTKELLLEKKEYLDKLAQALLEKEVLLSDDIEEILGKRMFEDDAEIEVIEKEEKSKTVKKKKSSPAKKKPISKEEALAE